MVGILVPSHLGESSGKANITAENGRNVGSTQARISFLDYLTQELVKDVNQALSGKMGRTLVRITAPEDNCST